MSIITIIICSAYSNIFACCLSFLDFWMFSYVVICITSTFFYSMDCIYIFLWIKAFDFNTTIVIFFFIFGAFGLLFKKYFPPPKTQKHSPRNFIVLLHVDQPSTWNWILVWSRGQVSFSSTWMSNWPRTLYWKDIFPTSLWFWLCNKSSDYIC